MCKNHGKNMFNEQNTRFLPDFRPKYKSSEKRYLGPFERENFSFYSRLLYKTSNAVHLSYCTLYIIKLLSPAS